MGNIDYKITTFIFLNKNYFSMIPNLLFKRKIPKNIPENIQKIIDEVKKSKNKEECLRKAYELLSNRYRGYRYRTYTHFFDLFQSFEKICKRTGFLHCTNLNYILRVVLVKTDFFKDSDIKQKITFITYFSIHQYLNVKINEKKAINVDLWGKAYGIKFGDYAHGFHY